MFYCVSYISFLLFRLILYPSVNLQFVRLNISLDKLRSFRLILLSCDLLRHSVSVKTWPYNNKCSKFERKTLKIYRLKFYIKSNIFIYFVRFMQLNLYTKNKSILDFHFVSLFINVDATMRLSKHHNVLLLIIVIYYR